MIIADYEHEANVLRRRMEWLDIIDTMIKSRLTAEQIESPLIKSITDQFDAVHDPIDLVKRLKEIHPEALKKVTIKE